MTVEKISNVVALSDNVKITSPFERNIWVESCGNYFASVINVCYLLMEGVKKV